MRIYLAGPDVFRPDAAARADSLRAVCTWHGVVGVSPLDPLADAPPAVWSGYPEWRQIALRNEAHMRACDALIANLTPFRGPSADVGTVYELGFFRALGRPVFGWSAEAAGFTERTVRYLGIQARQEGDGWRDGQGWAVESFGCADNLMIDGALAETGGLQVGNDMEAFERCVIAAARLQGG